MVKVKKKHGNEVVAAVAWTGWNLLEVEMFLGMENSDFPKSRMEHDSLIGRQEAARKVGIQVPTFSDSYITASMGEWIVMYNTGEFSVMYDSSFRENYHILEVK